MELRYDSSNFTAKATRYYGGAVRTADGLTWLAADHHGTANLAIDAADTNNVTRRRSMPFGERRGSAPSDWPDKRGFVNGTEDPTGLTHLGSREYDPTVGRFISVDPLIDLGSSQQINGYSYARNNPVSYSDPGGQEVVDGSTDSHQIAAMMRVVRIMQKYGAKDVYWAEANKSGADIICWDCGKDILVWEVKPSGEKLDIGKTISRLTGGSGKYRGRDVKAGDPLNPEQTGMSDHNKRVTVYDSDTPGLQWYDVEQDRDREKNALAIQVIDEARAEIRRAEDDRDGPPTQPQPAMTSPVASPQQLALERRHLENDAGEEGMGAGIVRIHNDAVIASEPWDDVVSIGIVVVIAGGAGISLVRTVRTIASRPNIATRYKRLPPVNPRYSGNASRDRKMQKELDRFGV